MTSLVERFVQKYSRWPTEFDKDYLEMLNMSKYRILDVPDRTPGTCANCGSAKNDGRKYVDFGKDIDWFGVIFICGQCLTDVAEVMGLFEKLRTYLHNYMVENAKANLEIERLKKVIDSFGEVKNYLDSVSSSGNDAGSNRTSSVESSKQESNSTEQGAAETNTRVTKPPTVSRSQNVRSLTSLLDIDS